LFIILGSIVGLIGLAIFLLFLFVFYIRVISPSLQTSIKRIKKLYVTVIDKPNNVADSSNM
jgi:hypothetical protein